MRNSNSGCCPAKRTIRRVVSVNTHAPGFHSRTARPEVRAKGLKILIYNETVRVTPNPIRLPGCFNMTFDVEILDSINQVPNSYIGKNEFQLFELPDIEKMQCQNASNNGCGGYGNNW
jgi:hypothetical protein